ncbi:MAG: hypothetical protein IPN20_00130 [Haliscomenobacter sp.]|nr:hypothetical protein [Haliscomenobacter sp.]
MPIAENFQLRATIQFKASLLSDLIAQSQQLEASISPAPFVKNRTKSPRMDRVGG